MEMETRDDITDILQGLEHGDRTGLDGLMARVYDELRVLARAQLRGERAGHTLATTDLVHEVYLRLADHDALSWKNRAHFFGAAAQVMRRVLVDHARRKNAAKRKGQHVTLADLDPAASQDLPLDTILEIDRALDDLSRINERLVRVVEARYFAGLTIRETAEVLGVSHATVSEDWRIARIWLKRRLG